MTESKSQQRPDHDTVKHTLASSIRQYINDLPDGHTGKVNCEERILDGRRRVDVALHRDFGDKTGKWAFEVKVKLSDAIGVSTQLDDYEKAGYTPVLVKLDPLHPSGAQPNGKLSSGPVAVAKMAGEKVRFIPTEGFHDDVCLRGLSRYWEFNQFKLSHGNDLSHLHRAILDALGDGRCTPSYLAELTGESRQLMNSRLRDLMMGGHVEKVHKGLYEVTSDPREGENET